MCPWPLSPECSLQSYESTGLTPKLGKGAERISLVRRIMTSACLRAFNLIHTTFIPTQGPHLRLRVRNHCSSTGTDAFLRRYTALLNQHARTCGFWT